MKQTIAIILVLFLVSCGKSKTKKPDNLIPKKQMVNLLFDMHLANRSRNIKNLQGDKKPDYFPLIYKKYHIDSTQFKESHEYYMSELPEYIEIYQKLEDSIFSLLKEQEKKLKVQDSITKEKKKEKLKKMKSEKKLLISDRVKKKKTGIRKK